MIQIVWNWQSWFQVLASYCSQYLGAKIHVLWYQFHVSTSYVFGSLVCNKRDEYRVEKSKFIVMSVLMVCITLFILFPTMLIF